MRRFRPSALFGPAQDVPRGHLPRSRGEKCRAITAGFSIYPDSLRCSREAVTDDHLCRQHAKTKAKHDARGWPTTTIDDPDWRAYVRRTRKGGSR